MPTKNSPTKNLIFATISFAIAVVCWSGLVLANDPIGRIIFGTVWTLLGIGWLGRYFVQRKAAAPEPSPE